MKKRAPKSKILSSGFRVVALGGGTGLSTLLRGLKELVIRRVDEHASTDRPIADLAAIVTVTDDGGSSGRLRRENRILPPGDIRNCMVALSKDEALLGRLFQYRFHAGRGLVGHNFGNLFLAALTHVTGYFTEAIRVSSKVLAIRGRIFPSTLSNVHLVATLENGRIVHGETAGYALADHLRAIQKHVPRRVIDWVVANRQVVSPEVARRYRAQGAEPVSIDLPALQKLGFRVILDNLLEEHGVLRHNTRRLSRLLLEEFLRS